MKNSKRTASGFLKAWRSYSFSKLIYVISNFQYNAFRWRNCWSRRCYFTIYCTINFIANVKLSLPVIRASNQERKQNKLHCQNTTFLNWLLMSLKGLWHRSAHVRHYDFWTGEREIKSWLSVKKSSSIDLEGPESSHVSLELSPSGG